MNKKPLHNPTIGFDLDGVLISDIIVTATNGAVQFAAEHVFPLFQPTIPWVIITARPCVDHMTTEAWAQRRFRFPPQQIFHENPDHTRYTQHIAYKASILKTHPEIKLYIENNPEVIRGLQSLAQQGEFAATILDFPQWIARSIERFYSTIESKGTVSHDTAS